MTAPAILYVHDLRGSGVVTNAIALARRLGAERETLLVAGYDKGLNRAIDVSPARLVVLGRGEEPKRAAAGGGAQAAAAGARQRAPGWSCRWAISAIPRCSSGRAGSASIRSSGSATRSAGRRRASATCAGAAGSGCCSPPPTRIVLVGRALAEQPLFKPAVAAGKAAYIANGVDVDRARAMAAAPSPHAWFDDGGPPVVLTIGRIHPQKNLEGLIDAAALAMAAKAACG